MGIPHDVLYKRMFQFAAIWNLVAGVSGIFFPEIQFRYFFGSLNFSNHFYLGVFYRLFMFAVVVFGIGYYIVSLDLTLNRGIVWLGGVAKIILFFVASYLYAIGKASVIIWTIFLGDFLWGAAFLTFLYHTRKFVKNNMILG